MSAELNDDAKLGASKERERATPSSTGTGAEVVDTVRGIVEDAKSGALNTAENSKDAVAAQLDDVAKAVHRSGEQLEGHQDWMAQWVERGADQLSGLASTLRTNDLKGLFGEIEELARSQPALFVGAAMAAGFATARLSKVAVAGASRADLPEMPEVLRERESD
jgi:hypothetical protein